MQNTQKMQKTRTTVKIAGREYTITGYDAPEYVQRVAADVDRRINELAAVAGSRSAGQLAVLVAVNATDDMIKSRDEIRRLRRENEALRSELEALKNAQKA